MVKKCSFWIILELISLLNSFTCFRIYRRKASLDHLHSSMMVNTGTWAKYIAIAAPLLAEWRPICLDVNPRESRPKEVTAKRRRFNHSVPEKKNQSCCCRGSDKCLLYRREMNLYRILSWLLSLPRSGRGTADYLQIYVVWLCHFLCRAFGTQKLWTHN